MLGKKFMVCLVGIMAFLFTIQGQTYAMAYELEHSNREEIVKSIQERDPDALIFDTQEDADKYFEELQNVNNYHVEVEESERPFGMRADEVTKDYDVKVTHNLVSAVHLCYSYTVKNGGRFFGSQVGEPFVSMSGYHPGTDFDKRSARVVKEDSQNLSARFVVYYKYYIVVKPIQLNSVTYEYNISHDILLGPAITSINEL